MVNNIRDESMYHVPCGIPVAYGVAGFAKGVLNSVAVYYIVERTNSRQEKLSIPCRSKGPLLKFPLGKEKDMNIPLSLR
jgi:hypothetical protein